jgi:hypothetical protein
VGQPVELQLGEPGPELLQVLAPEETEDEVGRGVLAPAGDQGEDQTGQQRLVEDGDGAVLSRHAQSTSAAWTSFIDSGAKMRSWKNCPSVPPVMASITRPVTSVE